MRGSINQQLASERLGHAVRPMVSMYVVTGSPRSAAPGKSIPQSRECALRALAHTLDWCVPQIGEYRAMIGLRPKLAAPNRRSRRGIFLSL